MTRTDEAHILTLPSSNGLTLNPQSGGYDPARAHSSLLLLPARACTNHALVTSGYVCMYVKIRRHQHTRVHAHTGMSARHSISMYIYIFCCLNGIIRCGIGCVCPYNIIIIYFVLCRHKARGARFVRKNYKDLSRSRSSLCAQCMHSLCARRGPIEEWSLSSSEGRPQTQINNTALHCYVTRYRHPLSIDRCVKLLGVLSL